MNAVKSLLSQAPVMAYFDVNAQTRIITDASPVGLGAILVQPMELIALYTMLAAN